MEEARGKKRMSFFSKQLSFSLIDLLKTVLIMLGTGAAITITYEDVGWILIVACLFLAVSEVYAMFLKYKKTQVKTT